MGEVFDRLKAALADRYAIEREIGAGGMATVYLARDLRHDRKVAVKVLRPELAAVMGADRFLAEIRTTANLQHPNILPLFDSGEADAFLFYVMPYVEGVSLRDRLDRERQLPVDDAVSIAKGLAEALDYAHRKGVVHRDIKPANVLMVDGKPVISDFGIALAIGAAGGGRLTETGLSLGTPHYMSPEQATGDASIGPASDIYALGCVLYEMLAGEPPFTGGSAQIVLGKIISGEPKSVAEQRRSVPANVDAAIRRALEKLPADRFAHAQDFARALGDSSFRSASEVRERRPASWLPQFGPTAAVATVVLIALGWSVLRSEPATQAEPIERYQILLPDSAPVAFNGPEPIGLWHSSIALSADGRFLGYASPKGESTILFLRDMETGQVRELPSTDGADQPFFSADGAWIAFFSGTELRKVNVNGGPSQLLSNQFGRPEGGTWLPDGRILVAGSEGRVQYLVPEGGGHADSLPPIGAPDLRQPSFLPDGKWFVGTSGGGRLLVMNLETREALAITRGDPRPFATIGRTETIFGAQPIYVEPGYLVYLSVETNTLMALPFDARNRRVLGDPVPLQSGVRKQEDYWAHYVVSPNGTLIYAPGDDATIGGLVFMDPKRGTERLPVPDGRYDRLRISPDGRRVLTTVVDESGESTVYVLDPFTGQMEALRNPDGQNSDGRAWLSDSDIVISRLDRTTTETRGTIVYSLASGKEKPLSPVATQWIAFHKDDSLVVYTSPPGSGKGMISLRDGTETQGPDGVDFEFSPNGKWLASWYQGKISVRRFPLDGRSFRVPDGDLPGAEQPFWSPDGSAIYFRGVGQIRRVGFSPTGGPDGGPSFGKPETYLQGPFRRANGWAQDVHPDGRILVGLRSDVPSASHLEVVTGLPTLLRRIAPLN